MKKVFTILLALCMVLSLSGAVMAETTEVTYDAEADVPILYVPDTIETTVLGEFHVEGYWGADELLIATPDDTVKMYYYNRQGEQTQDYVTVKVTSNPISQAGDFNTMVSARGDFTVDEEDTMSQVVFGTWKGSLTFTVEYENNPNHKPGLSLTATPKNTEELRAASTGGYTKVVISEGTFEGESQTTYSRASFTDGSSVTISGGTFSGEIFGVDYADVTIDGGQFDTESLWFDGSTVTITDGTFTKPSLNIYGDGGTTVTVMGGTFAANPTKIKSGLVKLAEGYEAVENPDGTWNVLKPVITDSYELKKALQTISDAGSGDGTITSPSMVTGTLSMV